jgi:hypothetical protein
MHCAHSQANILLGRFLERKTQTFCFGIWNVLLAASARSSAFSVGLARHFHVPLSARVFVFAGLRHETMPSVTPTATATGHPQDTNMNTMGDDQRYFSNESLEDRGSTTSSTEGMSNIERRKVGA